MHDINYCRQNMIRSAGILFAKATIVQINVKISDNTLDIYANIYYNIKKNTVKEGMEMYRKVMEYLKSWKDSKYRKPLILQGARQVGKTYTLLEFGRVCYENVAYFNFETDPKLSTTFEDNISPDYLIPVLSHIS